MHRLTQLTATLALGGTLLLPGCFGQRLSLEEIRAAIDSVVLLGQARQAVDDVVEISTSFTIGQGVEAIIAEVQAFLESQAPCTTVEAVPGQITVDFGGLEDNCAYHGRTYGGQVVYTFELVGEEVQVQHAYTAFTNGQVTLDGNTDVTWGGGARRVETDYTVAGNDLTIESTSDRSMTWLDEAQGLAGGILINGDRAWTGPLGAWNMSIEDVEVRAQDPVPQAGRYELVTPRDVLASLSFSRVDDDTIELVFEGPKHRRVYHVTSIGIVEDVTDE